MTRFSQQDTFGTQGTKIAKQGPVEPVLSLQCPYYLGDPIKLALKGNRAMMEGTMTAAKMPKSVPGGTKHN